MWQVGAILHHGARASHYRGLSRCGAQAPDAQAQQLWLTGLVAPRHAGSSQTRARTRVPRIGRQILNHCATREALTILLIHNLFRLFGGNPSSLYQFLPYSIDIAFLLWRAERSTLDLSPTAMATPQAKRRPMANTYWAEFLCLKTEASSVLLPTPGISKKSQASSLTSWS